MALIHPKDALQEHGRSLPVIPVCVHYAGQEKYLRKAFALQEEYGPIFDIACDLEDGAPEGNVAQHLEMVIDLLRSESNRHGRAGVRIHSPASALWNRELDALLPAVGDRLAFITVPKAAGAGDVELVAKRLDEHAKATGEDRRIPLHVLIETPRALAEVRNIARLPGVEALEFGLLDFISEHGGAISAGAMRSPAQFEHRLLARAKTEIAAAALEHGVIPSHNITLDLMDGRQAYLDARRAREEFGFLRMWSIHPVQIKPIIQAMTPSFDELERMEGILLKAQQRDWAPMSVEGHLQDKASYRYYWDSLCRARMSGSKVSEAAEQAFFRDLSN